MYIDCQVGGGFQGVSKSFRKFFMFLDEKKTVKNSNI